MESNKPVVVFKNITLVSLCMNLHDMPNTTIDNVNLTNCQFKLIEMPRSGFDDVILIDSTLHDCNLNESYFAACDFTNATFSEIEMLDCAFTRINFTNAKLKKVNFPQSGLTEVSFKGSSLSNIDFSGTTLVDVDFTDAKFDHKSIKFNETIFHNCYIAATDIEKLNLTDSQKLGLLASPTGNSLFIKTESAPELDNMPKTEQVGEKAAIEVKIPVFRE